MRRLYRVLLAISAVVVGAALMFIEVRPRDSLVYDFAYASVALPQTDISFPFKWVFVPSLFVGMWRVFRLAAGDNGWSAKNARGSQQVPHGRNESPITRQASERDEPATMLDVVKSAGEPSLQPLIPRQYFWRGPITSAAQAEKIINVTGWGFLAFGILGLIHAIIPGNQRIGIEVESDTIGAMFTTLIFIVPSAFLLSRKNRLPAGILLGLCIIIAFLILALVVTVASSGDLTEGFGSLLVALLWFVPTLLCWRALKAAGALLSLRTGAVLSEVADSMTNGNLDIR